VDTFRAPRLELLPIISGDFAQGQSTVNAFGRSRIVQSRPFASLISFPDMMNLSRIYGFLGSTVLKCVSLKISPQFDNCISTKMRSAPLSANMETSHTMTPDQFLLLVASQQSSVRFMESRTSTPLMIC
jgi:hypothetical protein